MASKKSRAQVRQRQAARHRARERAIARQRAARRRRTVLTLLPAIALVVLLVAVGASQLRDDGGSTDVDAGSTTTEPAFESAVGKPCVPRTGELPAGAPEVPVKVGPPPQQLVTETLKEGTGEVVKEGATISAHYIGVSCSTGVVFDSSYSRGEPVSFPLSDVIVGWKNGIPGMKVGGQRLLGIPPDFAYGAEGRPPRIAPGETLWFVVEVLKVEA